MKYMRGKMSEQESKIASYEKLVEGTGHDLLLGDDAHNMEKEVKNTNPEEIIEYVIEMQDDPASIEKETRQLYEGAEQLLNEPFNFYSFSCELNKEQQIDIQSRVLYRYF